MAGARRQIEFHGFALAFVPITVSLNNPELVNI
jgi:hypothetical protein